MDAAVLSLVRIALLILLWVFILLALWAMRLDSQAARPGRSRTNTASAIPAPPVGRNEKAREITIVEGPLTGSHMDITQLDSIVLGRAQSVDFVLGDDYASARHARLFRRGGEWYVEDLESRNGTYLNGYRIDQPESVAVGADIKVGSTTVRLVP
ncbi:FHA domain-containing protein FhaB/FipA [Corynebacterium uterequi]|uniref:FHA domain-containing protein n=1 Tax=Corynebacterium uterequi TaxID=1072256 RepID=A0A0G3H9R4_9CORY|nr:FHA domain-containing protein [Corynebacterium uterequi]AKK10074.1 FHA domain-containing protein [Corynebacterium uterequi]